MTALRAGMKVVCVSVAVDDWYGEVFPDVGEVYTIRGMEEGDEFEASFLLLEEIRNPPYHYDDGFKEASFAASWFRPAVERKTSIEIFQKMLVPKKHEERV